MIYYTIRRSIENVTNYFELFFLFCTNNTYILNLIEEVSNIIFFLFVFINKL